MANKRMFSLSIVDTDAFIDMPSSSRLLYYDLAMRADDEGFVANPKKITRESGAGEDAFKVLIAKKFIIPFESGICVIKHWLIHNTIRMDRFHGTTHINEKAQLVIKDNKAYKLIEIKDGNQLATRLPQVNLIQSNLSKDNIEAEQSSAEIPLLIKEFESINPAIKRMYGNKTQRKACQDLIDTYGFERVLNVIKDTLPKTNKLEYMPTITTPLQLMDKWSSLESNIYKLQNKSKVADNKNNYVG